MANAVTAAPVTRAPDHVLFEEPDGRPIVPLPPPRLTPEALRERLRVILGNQVHPTHVPALGVDVDAQLPGSIVCFIIDPPVSFPRTLERVRRLTQELRVNLLARERRVSLVRLRSDITPDSLASMEAVFAAAHHVVTAGEVTREGTFRLRDDVEPILTRDHLIRLNEVDLFPDAPGRDFTERVVLPIVREFFRAHVAHWGWFYPEVDADPAARIIDKLRAPGPAGDLSGILHGSTHGSAWLKTRFRSYWNVNDGPAKAFHDDRSLNSVLRYRLGLNNSKDYSYVLSDGRTVSCRETFDINIKNVRFGFIVQRKGVSFFRPSAARDVYAHFLQGIDEPRVWDPSAGFGGRLLGFAAMLGPSRSGEYVACEPACETHLDNINLSLELQDTCPGLRTNIRQVGSEVIRLEPGTVDLVFTSPPYFDKERYFDEPGQCWRDYPSLETWSKGYLLRTAQTALEALRPGRPLVINVSGDLSEVVVAVARKAGFLHDGSEDVELHIMRDHFLKKRSSSRTAEVLLVFRKPS